MKIKLLDKDDEEAWKNYLKKNKKTKFQHTFEIRNSIKDTYKNCEPFYFILENKRKIEAIFPFFLVKSKIFGNRLISLPFVDVGGFFGRYDFKSLKELLEEIKKLGRECEHVEIRLNKSFDDFDKIRKLLLKLGFEKKEEKHQFIVLLTSKEDMWKRFHKHTRNDIRKAQKSGLKIKKLDGKKEMEKFYELYSKEMRNFGTPQHSYKFFSNIFSEMRKKVVGFNCYKDQKMIGSLIMFYHNDSGYIAFNVSNTKYRNFRPNDLLYWTALNWGFENNLNSIDLGQVEKNAQKKSHAWGIYKFKEKWLGKLQDRIYFKYHLNGKAIHRKSKEKYKKFRSVWKKLPLFITKKLGPKVASQLGV